MQQVDGAPSAHIDEAIAAEVVFDAWIRIASNELRRQERSTLNQFWVLLIASDRGGISTSSMARLLELNYTTIAECVNSLERLGAITKKRRRERPTSRPGAPYFLREKHAQRAGSLPCPHGAKSPCPARGAGEDR